MRNGFDKGLNAINSASENLGGLDEKVLELKSQREAKNAELTTVEENIEGEFKTLEVLRDQSSKLDVRKFLSKIPLVLTKINKKC